MFQDFEHSLVSPSPAFHAIISTALLSSAQLQPRHFGSNTHRQENSVSIEGSVLAVPLDSCQADPGSEWETEPRGRMPRVDLVSEAQSGKERGEEKG